MDFFIDDTIQSRFSEQTQASRNQMRASDSQIDVMVKANQQSCRANIPANDQQPTINDDVQCESKPDLIT